MRLARFFCVLSSFPFNTYADPSNAVRFASVMLHRDISPDLRSLLFQYIYEKDVTSATFYDAARLAEALWRVDQLSRTNLPLTQCIIWTDQLFARECLEMADYAFCCKIRDLAALWILNMRCAGDEANTYECTVGRYRAIDAWSQASNSA